MSWLDGRSDAEAAAELAIGEAARLTLPITTRSLTRAEVLNRHQGMLRLSLFAYAVFALVLLAVLANASAAPGRGLAVWLIATPAGAWVAWLLGRKREQRDSGYRDPEIRIEVREDGIHVAAPAGEEIHRWDEVALEVMPVIYNDSTHFGGIRLETGFGQQQVDDICYKEGRKAAAAIVRRTSQAHQARERAKVGRIG